MFEAQIYISGNCAKSVDRLSGLVARVPGYRPRSPSSIPSAIRFSKK
jgi:hypothetical protein